MKQCGLASAWQFLGGGRHLIPDMKANRCLHAQYRIPIPRSLHTATAVARAIRTAITLRAISSGTKQSPGLHRIFGTAAVFRIMYGGMIASLLDCHGAASAAAFSCQKEGRHVDDSPQPIRFVTASLKVDFRRPTPFGIELVIKGRLRSLEGRKAWIDLILSAGDVTCAVGDMLAIRLQDHARR
ncbi:PaaI family thioesterase [Paraburkholderia azotifigens]|uniref:PaaI family thioesterase n=1 Tax=Paraburkholderia azotifigens TaxID=2057004 RepID=UPI00317FFDD3